MQSPLVTILTPTYNRAGYIAEAIKSILAQTFTDWELIIIDDASTDDTAAVVRSFIQKNPNISYIKQDQNVGIARNRNTGLDKARGKYIAVLDSDDIWTDPDKLQKQIDFLKAHEKCAVLGTWVKKIDTQGKEIGDIKYDTADANIRRKMLLTNQFAHSSTVFLRSAMIEAGGYSTAYTIGDDYDLMLKIGTKYEFANLPEFTTAYRIHDTNITKTKRAQHVREHLAIIKKYRSDYPGFFGAMIKSYLRIFLAN